MLSFDIGDGITSGGCHISKSWIEFLFIWSNLFFPLSSNCEMDKSLPQMYSRFSFFSKSIFWFLFVYMVLRNDTESVQSFIQRSESWIIHLTLVLFDFPIHWRAAQFIYATLIFTSSCVNTNYKSSFMLRRNKNKITTTIILSRRVLRYKLA